MRRFRALGFVVCGLALPALGQSPTAGAPALPTIASAVDREISGVERQLVEAAETMPADRTSAVAHAFDHYSQMVEYLRMNGIVPPASRGKAD